MNLEILLANKAKRAAFQVKLVAREREKKADDAKAAQRARWERGDFSDPVAEKHKEREEKARRREARARRKEADTPVPAAEEPGALVVAGSVGDGTAVATAEATASLREDAVVASLAESGTSDTATRLSVAGNQVPHFFVFGDLRPGMTYRLRVAGVSAIGQGKWSATTVSTTTLATPPAQPQPPTVDPRHVELFSLRVGWTSPDEHGSALVGYKLRCCRDGTAHNLSANDVSLELKALDPGEGYTFQLCASNQLGWGPWSEASEAVWTFTSTPEPPRPPAVAATGVDWVDLHVAKPFSNGGESGLGRRPHLPGRRG